jgi:tungstate transport system substrate-binding protein
MSRPRSPRLDFSRALSALALFGAALGLGPASPAAAYQPLILASTYSTENSGLLDALVPKFTDATGIAVRAVIAGTGQVLNIGRGGDCDAILSHDAESEIAFVAEGFGAERRAVMYNRFLLVGPADDPAGARGMTDAATAFAAIARVRALFLSRGDDSGTNKAERRLWTAAGIDPGAEGEGWYRETGVSQGANLNIASGLGAYTLTDSSTWLAFGNRGPLEALVTDGPRLFNQYAVTLVSPERHPHVQAAKARAFMDWITAPEGQAAIGAYRIDGRKAFVPNAAPED